MLKYGTFCHENIDFSLRAEENGMHCATNRLRILICSVHHHCHHIVIIIVIVIIISDPEHPFVFGGVLFLGTWLSMMISTVNGAGTPVLVRLYIYDDDEIAMMTTMTLITMMTVTMMIMMMQT